MSSIRESSSRRSAAASVSRASSSRRSTTVSGPRSDIPKVVFVLGGPGAGKGTQCAKIIEHFSSWGHISAGDCLREEKANPDSKYGELINTYIKEGKIVPVKITVRLLLNKIASLRKEGKTSFLVDGFPRNIENLEGWEAHVGRKAYLCGVLAYEVPEEELVRRLLARGETGGRIDDNITTIKKRFNTFNEETQPVMKKFEACGLITRIDGTPSPEEVWKVTKASIERFNRMKLSTVSRRTTQSQHRSSSTRR